MQSHPAVRQVVVIGTSTGGLTALRDLLSGLPSDLDAAVFITMHIGSHDSSLPAILANSTSLEVSYAKPDEEIKNGHIYVAPPDRHLLIGKKAIRTVHAAKENHARPAIDPMFRSAAISHRSNAIGVILTGQLDDGIVGLQAIKAYGGTALVQDPSTAEAPSMPANAIRFLQVDACLPIPELAQMLGQIVQKMSTQADSSSDSTRIEPFATENDLTQHPASGNGNAQALDAIGEVTGTSCPDCGGALWAIDDSFPHFRCHTGHSYTAATLQESQNGVIEEALWVATRALHEKQLLLGRLAEMNKDTKQSSQVNEYQLAIDNLESHKATLRALLTSASHRPSQI